MGTAVHHVGLTVESIAETQRFYSRHFGFVPEEDVVEIATEWFATGVNHEGAHVNLAFLRRDDLLLELMEFVHPRPARRSALDVADMGAIHIAFKVDDIDAVRDSLLAEDVKVYSPPMEVSGGGSLAPLAGIRWCFCEDPNGCLLELIYEPTSEATE